MKMSNYFICCERCMHDIAFWSTSSAKLWMDLCNLYIKKGEYVILKGQDVEELEYLERCRFITTTDMPEHIGIHIHGHMKTLDNEDFFCIREGKHD
jgi:hypothetical protein